MPHVQHGLVRKFTQVENSFNMLTKFRVHRIQFSGGQNRPVLVVVNKLNLLFWKIGQFSHIFLIKLYCTCSTTSDILTIIVLHVLHAF